MSCSLICMSHYNVPMGPLPIRCRVSTYPPLGSELGQFACFDQWDSIKLMKKLEEGLCIRVQELLLLGTFASHCEQAQASILESERPEEERHQPPGHPNCPRQPSHSVCRHVNKSILKYLTQPTMRAMRNGKCLLL